MTRPSAARRLHIRAPKDFWSGVMFVAIAGVAIVEARGYSLGTSTKMGPGYLPLVLGAVLGSLGLILIASSLVLTGEDVELLQLRPIGVLVLSVTGFGLMMPVLGLVVSLIAVTLAAAAASGQSRPLEAVALSVFVAGLSVLVFIFGLRLPLSIWPTF